MRHLKANRKLGRNTKRRISMLRSMADSLVLHGTIKTTHAKAKEIKRWVERAITIAKGGNTHIVVRRLKPMFFQKEAVKKLITEIAPRYSTREGGYLAVYKLGFRAGDGAKMAVVTFVEEEK